MKFYFTNNKSNESPRRFHKNLFMDDFKDDYQEDDYPNDEYSDETDSDSECFRFSHLPVPLTGKF